MQEAELKQTDNGKVAAGEGWYTLHASEAEWYRSERFGTLCRFEGDARFPELGINLRVLEPGQPACLYHRESAQEDFFVVSGECTLIVEGEERPLRAGHFVHCPADTLHVFVGAGDGPCAIIAVGARPQEHTLWYPVDETAARHDASASAATDNPAEAYAGAERGPTQAVWPLP
ncbi:MAG: cupin domain-containing protein [Acidobacteriota bacterium]|jgi:uncharacterized cupin superfamily protein